MYLHWKKSSNLGMIRWVNVIHLNNAGAGLMPDIVTQAQLDHIKLEAEIGAMKHRHCVRMLSPHFMNRQLIYLIASHRISLLQQVLRIPIQEPYLLSLLRKGISF